MGDEKVSGSRGPVLLVIRLLGGRSGGAERLFCETANMLADLGYEVTALYCDSSKKAPFYPLSRRVALINLWGGAARGGIAYRALASIAASERRFGKELVADWLSKNAYFTRRLHQAMIGIRPIVAISFLPPANTPTLLAGAIARTPVVPTNHNVPAKDYESLDRWDPNPLDRWLRLRLLRTAARIHVLFDSFGAWFPAELHDRIEVVENYVSDEFFEAYRPSESRSTDSRRVLGVGRLARVKNFQDMVAAWGHIANSFPTWRAEILGEGPDAGNLKSQIQQLGVAASFSLAGAVSDVLSYYVSSDVLCHPALHEGFGLSVAEAMACGLPVVAYRDCDGVREFVREGENGLMVERRDSSEGIARALSRLMSDRALRMTLGARAHTSVQRFNRKRYAERWVDIIESVRRDRDSERRRTSFRGLVR